MTTAFVLSGGASLGAVQVGMLSAMEAAGIRPDLVIGTSVGAINAAWIAADADWRLDRLEQLWTSMRRTQVFPSRPTSLFGLLGRRAGLVDHGPLARLIRQQLPYQRLEEAAVPLHVIVTDVLTGRDVRLSSGPAVEAVLASAAIPGVFAPVVIDGRAYMDGGVVNNAAVSHAVDLGATTVYVLPTGFACSLERPPASAIAMALHGLSVLVQHRLADDVEHFRAAVTLHVVPPPCPITVGPADFSHARKLIDAGAASTAAWLQRGCQPDLRTLRPHDHSH
ncbi:MAG: patatin-like phospholipase family protein [Actinobacteria bacterium]|nr:patatin-like phospholipase family protein [Actinomycetota bacterium]